MHKHTLPTLEEIKNNLPILRNPVYEVNLTLTPLERFAVGITKMIGSMGFFFLVALWTIVWLVWNVTAPVELRFDPAPAFVIWLFVSNVLQLILLPLIMVGQNLENKVSEERAEADFEVNKKSEAEIEIVIGHLENQNKLLETIVQKLN